LRSVNKASHLLGIHLARNERSGACDVDSGGRLSPNTGGTIDVRKPQWCSAFKWLPVSKCVIRPKGRFIKRHFVRLLVVRRQ